MKNHRMEPIHRTALPPSFNDLPPPDFIPPDPEEVDAPTAPPPAVDRAPRQPEKVTRTPIRIVRACTGSNELRLMNERVNGTHKQFVLERTRISPPYMREFVFLVKNQGGTEVPLKEKEANRAFDRAVAATFPDIELRPGFNVPTSTVIL